MRVEFRMVLKTRKPEQIKMAIDLLEGIGFPKATYEEAYASTTITGYFYLNQPRVRSKRDVDTD